MSRERMIFTNLRTPLSEWNCSGVLGTGELNEANSRPSQLRRACRVVRLITKEAGHLAGAHDIVERAQKQRLSQSRQIAMYVCHVALQFSLSEVGQAFNRDRTTVAYACRVIEDRRDDRAFDEFVASIERLSISILADLELLDDA